MAQVGGAGKVLVPIQALPGSINGSAHYTVTGTGTKAVIRGQSFSNITGGAVTITLHWVPSGETPGNSNKRLGATSLAANTTWEPEYQDGAWVMELGDALWCFASAANSINWSVSGDEVRPSQMYAQRGILPA